MRDCTVMLDNEVILERGRFVDERMRVMQIHAVMVLRSAV